MNSCATRRLRIAFGVLLPLLVAAGIGAAGPDEEPIRIGVAGPMDGDQGKMGQDILNGVRLAMDECNRGGGLLGRTVEIIEGNDQHDPRQARQVADRFLDAGVVGVIGHFNSDCSIPASEVYAEEEIVQITPASTNPRYTDRGLATLFRVCGRDDQQGRVAADYVADVLEKRRIAVLHDRTTYGQGLADAFSARLAERGIEPVFTGGIVQGEQDYRAVLGSVKTHDPEVLFFGGIYREGGLLARQAREQGLTATFLGGDGVFDQTFVEIAGVESAEGSCFTFTPDVRNVPSAAQTLRSYEERFGEPGPYSIYGYVAAQVMLEGIRRAGTAEGAPIARALHQGVYETVLGPFSFDERGDTRFAPYVVYVTRAGKFVQHTGLDGRPLAGP